MRYFFTAQKYILYVYYASKKLNFFRNPIPAYFAAILARLAIAEAKTKSLSSGLSACRISSLVPSHHLRPSCMYTIFSPISITEFISCVLMMVVILYSRVIS